MVARFRERGSESIDDLAFEAESDLGVDGDGDAGVAEEFLDRGEFDCLLQDQGDG